MRIDFQVVPHKKQRYDTVGDYFYFRKVLNFRVSKMRDARYPILVFLHELIEFLMCRHAGVSLKAIDKFDTEYEKTRPPKPNRHILAPCGCHHCEEPGDDLHAPYKLQHEIATKCEWIIARAMGVDWKKYNATIKSL